MKGSIIVSIFLISCHWIFTVGKKTTQKEHVHHQQRHLREDNHRKYLNYYPDNVPAFPVRVDKDGKTVTTGRLHAVGGIPSDRRDFYRRKKDRKVSLEEFKDTLQCAPTQSIIDSETGTYSMVKMIKPSKEILEIACAWGETRCHPWTKCQEIRKQYNEGNYPPEYGMNHFDGFQTLRLIRITNGTAYLDWPWDPYRIDKEDNLVTTFRQHFFILELTLRKIFDFPDVVVFFGGERPVFPWNFPIPAFTYAPSYEYSQIAWPWIEGASKEYDLYKSFFPDQIEDADGRMANKKTTIDQDDEDRVHQFLTSPRYFELTNQRPWDQRIAKAAYFGNCDHYRRIVFEQGRLYPDVVDSSFTASPMCTLYAINPSSNETRIDGKQLEKMTDAEKEAAQSLPPGYAAPLAKYAHMTKYSPGHYKYVVTMLGMNGISTSGRIAYMLAHSGAVVMLSKSSYHYHFSAEFKPWVHYVPLAYSGADLAEKVRWLQEHDDIARQIAENGRNFGRSYLRLEDYFCYAANTLESFADLMEGSDILEPFHPMRLSPVEVYN